MVRSADFAPRHADALVSVSQEADLSMGYAEFDELMAAREQPWPFPFGKRRCSYYGQAHAVQWRCPASRSSSVV